MGLLIRDVIRMGEQRLSDAGVHDAAFDSSALFMYLYNTDRNGLFKLWGTEIDDRSFEAYCELLDTRASGMPLQYITGTQDFMGFTFRVTPDVLIPRLDTEVVVEEALRLIGERRCRTVLDLCTGSGAIAVSVAKLAAGTQVTGSDISSEALKIASENARTNGAKVTYRCGDLFEPFRRKLGGGVKFDMIISNPPYIPSSDIDGLMTEVRDHEPVLALDGGDDGLDFYRRIVSEAPEHLKKGGILVLEIGFDQAESIAGFAEGKYSNISVKKDLAGLDRAMILMI